MGSEAGFRVLDREEPGENGGAKDTGWSLRRKMNVYIGCLVYPQAQFSLDYTYP